MSGWRRARVAASGTHHVVDGAPLYSARFAEVLAFHEPGLAPARDASGAFHIDEAGGAAYQARYLRTFGFYEGLAAVRAESGAHHVRPDGTPVYARRYAWCGNYQGGRCAVRDVDGRYLHLDELGSPAYASRFRYVGDYRDGVAVAQGDDGLCTHVDREGRLIHARGFLDLDVFHKGFARARDEGGWMHVDRAGRPVYARRFAMVEPFYNGQARVERYDGALEVVDERGDTLVELRAPVETMSLPEGLIATLRALAETRAAVVLIRHAERCSLAPGASEHEVDISPEGERRAASLGRMLQSRSGLWIETSPLRRCHRTAERILLGAAQSADIARNTLLGDPGPFVVDARGGGALFATLGTERVVRGQIAGETWPPLRATAAGARLLVGDLVRRLRQRGGMGIAISHDTIVMPVIAALTGETFERAWLAPLDGIAFARDADDRIYAIWRGARVEIDT